MKLIHALQVIAVGIVWMPFKALAVPLESSVGPLSDPAEQPKFVELAPNALDPGFLFKDLNEKGKPHSKPNFLIKAKFTRQEVGLINPRNGRKLMTDLWGYGKNTISWPGQTIQVMSKTAGGAAETIVQWENALRTSEHLLPVDTSLHWAYSLHGDSSANGVDYTQYSIDWNAVPMVPHLHGAKTDFQFDGNPEFFFDPWGDVIGPQWDSVDGGFTNTFKYDNGVPAGNLWYHDHALGITRLNVYAGLAGFYFVRDNDDTGLPDNPLGLPAFPYELAYAIQDRMFTQEGQLFYPAFPDDPFYDGFITDEGVTLPDNEFFANGGPTALAEFFGDHMVVNGKIWPKTDVEPRNYRLRLLNGCDSRFLVVQFCAAETLADTDCLIETALDFTVIGSDQGLGDPKVKDTLVIEPGGRYDIIFDFKGLNGKRIIMKNLGGDAPFGGDYVGKGLEYAEPTNPSEVEEYLENFFPYPRQTDRIMAFDVEDVLDVTDNFNADYLPAYVGNTEKEVGTRRVALFEGLDEYGRLQPLLGTVSDSGKTTALTWFQPTTEKPTKGTTEIWEIYNLTGDAHPIHLHLVNFQILGRASFGFTIDSVQQTTLQHNGETGLVDQFDIDLSSIVDIGTGDEYFETAPKDMVTALPGDTDNGMGELVRIKVTFEKAGRYVWHCHILSHEDHEMMRVLQVEEKS